LLSGSLKAFDEMGHAVPAESWLSNNLHSPRARAFRLRADDLRTAGLVPSEAAAPASPVNEASAVLNGLPSHLASDPIASAAFDAMYRFAEDFRQQHGGPPLRDDAARAANREVTAYPVRKARSLYRYLPDSLRNPSRSRHP
jgi:hypothetical protein